MTRETDDDRLWDWMRQEYAAPPPDDEFAQSLGLALERELGLQVPLPPVDARTNLAPRMPAAKLQSSRFAPACVAALALVSVGLLALSQGLNSVPEPVAAHFAIVEVPFRYSLAANGGVTNASDTLSINWADSDGDSNDHWEANFARNLAPQGLAGFQASDAFGMAGNGAQWSPPLTGFDVTSAGAPAVSNGRTWPYYPSPRENLRTSRLVVRGRLHGLSAHGVQFAMDRVIYGNGSPQPGDSGAVDGIAVFAAPASAVVSNFSDLAQPDFTTSDWGTVAGTGPGHEAILFCSAGTGIAAIAPTSDLMLGVQPGAQVAVTGSQMAAPLDRYEAQIVATLEHGDFLDPPITVETGTHFSHRWSAPQDGAFHKYQLFFPADTAGAVVIKAKLESADTSISRWDVIRVLSGGWPHAEVTVDQQLLRQRAEAVARFRARSKADTRTAPSSNVEAILAKMLHAEFVPGRVALLFVEPKPQESGATVCRLLYRAYDEPHGKLAAFEQHFERPETAVEASGKPILLPAAAPP